MSVKLGETLARAKKNETTQGAAPNFSYEKCSEVFCKSL